MSSNAGTEDRKVKQLMREYKLKYQEDVDEALAKRILEYRSLCQKTVSGPEASVGSNLMANVGCSSSIEKCQTVTKQPLLQTSINKSLGDVNPEKEKNERRRRRSNRKLNVEVRRSRSLFNSNGVFVPTGEDLCDCLIYDCPGCHFPCPTCESTKCGYDCRCNRNWAYESIEDEGSDIVIKNPYCNKN